MSLRLTVVQQTSQPDATLSALCAQSASVVRSATSGCAATGTVGWRGWPTSRAARTPTPLRTTPRCSSGIPPGADGNYASPARAGHAAARARRQRPHQQRACTMY